MGKLFKRGGEFFQVFGRIYTPVRDDTAPDDVDDEISVEAPIIDFSTAQLYINALIKFGAKNNNNEIITISQKLDNLIEKCEIANNTKQTTILDFFKK